MACKLGLYSGFIGYHFRSPYNEDYTIGGGGGGVIGVPSLWKLPYSYTATWTPKYVEDRVFF